MNEWIGSSDSKIYSLEHPTYMMHEREDIIPHNNEWALPIKKRVHIEDIP